MSAVTQPTEGVVGLNEGLHSRIPAGQYHALTFASQSYLKLLAEGYSPAHVKEQLDHPAPSTAAMALGSAIHALVLQPEEAIKTVLMGPTKTRGTKAWEEQVAANARQVPGPDPSIWLTPDEWDKAQAIADAVRNHRGARMFLERPDSEAELTGLWRTVGLSEETEKPPEEQANPDTPFPVWCKFRLDLWTPSFNTVLDLKTTEDASKGAFQRSLLNFGYHYQAGWYLEGMRRLGFAAEHFVVVAVEKSPPYAVAIYRMADGVAEYGLDQLWTPLETFSRCMAQNNWTGYPEEVQDIQLPPWAMRDVNALG